MRYPIAMDLTDRLVVFFGGGAVAERRIGDVLACGGRVEVVAPALTPSLRELADGGEISWQPSEFDGTISGGPVLVFAATDDAKINDSIVERARAQGLLASSASGRERDFAPGATSRCGPITVSAWSATPALSTRLRDEMTTVARRHERLARFLAALRPAVKGSGIARTTFWRMLVAAAPMRWDAAEIEAVVVGLAEDCGIEPLDQPAIRNAFEVASTQ